MLEALLPISNAHSINRVIAVFHVPQQIMRPDLAFEKLKDLEGLKKFQKNGLTRVRKFNFHSKEENVITSEDINGFVFEEYKDGKVFNILQVVNEEEGRSSIRYENRIYPRWAQFLNFFTTDVTALIEPIGLYVDGISLTYVDEFVWKSDLKIDVEKVFNQDSELLNKKFFSSNNGAIISITQDTPNDCFIEEKLEVTFNNMIKRIIINHQCYVKLNEIVLLDKNSIDNIIKSNFELAHKTNKEALKDILSQETRKQINLN